VLCEAPTCTSWGFWSASQNEQSGSGIVSVRGRGVEFRIVWLGDGSKLMHHITRSQPLHSRLRVESTQEVENGLLASHTQGGLRVYLGIQDATILSAIHAISLPQLAPSPTQSPTPRWTQYRSVYSSLCTPNAGQKQDDEAPWRSRLPTCRQFANLLPALMRQKASVTLSMYLNVINKSRFPSSRRYLSPSKTLTSFVPNHTTPNSHLSAFR
jgi:hypothetical protein